MKGRLDTSSGSLDHVLVLVFGTALPADGEGLNNEQVDMSRSSRNERMQFARHDGIYLVTNDLVSGGSALLAYRNALKAIPGETVREVGSSPVIPLVRDGFLARPHEAAAHGAR